MRKTIEDVIAEAAIRDVQMRYCRACDRMDFELLRACFHGDATADYGVISGSVDHFIASLQAALLRFVVTTHNTGNQNIVVNGDTALAEHYTLATHRLAADADGPLRDIITSVRYIDRMECREGDWRIARRVLVLDWTRTEPVSDGPPDPDVPRAARDRSDLSYTLP
jgi:hypothetical protein